MTNETTITLADGCVYLERNRYTHELTANVFASLQAAMKYYTESLPGSEIMITLDLAVFECRPDGYKAWLADLVCVKVRS